MKNAIVLFILVFASYFSSVAQDIITLKTGEELKATIIRLNPKDVAFIAESSTDTSLILREQVAKLFYKSGTVIYLTDNYIPSQTISNEPINDSMYIKGEKDATSFYKGYKSAGTGTLICSLFVPLGLIPAIACSTTPPSAGSLGYRDIQLFENPSYYAGYTNKAFKIKKKKVWENFAIGTGITVAYYALIIGVLGSL
jgi:hypothetical protein